MVLEGQLLLHKYEMTNYYDDEMDEAGNYQVYREDLEPLLQDYQILQYLRVKDSDSKYRDIFHIDN